MTKKNEETDKYVFMLRNRRSGIDKKDAESCNVSERELSKADKYKTDRKYEILSLSSEEIYQVYKKRQEEMEQLCAETEKKCHSLRQEYEQLRTACEDQREKTEQLNKEYSDLEAVFVDLRDVNAKVQGILETVGANPNSANISNRAEAIDRQNVSQKARHVVLAASPVKTDTLKPTGTSYKDGLTESDEESKRDSMLRKLRECEITVPSQEAAPPHQNNTDKQNSQSLEQDDTKPERTKKSFKARLGDIAFYGFMILLLIAVIFVWNGNDGMPKSIAGYSAFTVLTGSMDKEIPQGSLVITKRTDPSLLQIGDDITYFTNQTTTITHKIVGITENYQDTGQRAFQTQGVMNNEPDKLPVPANNVIGKVVYHNLTLGKVAAFVKQNWPLLLFLIVILIVSAKVLHRVFRKE